MDTTGYSLADIAAATGGSTRNDGGAFGDGGWLWIIVVFALLFGWGGNGFGGGFGGGGSGVQGALTRGDLCMDMNFQEVKREVQNANDATNLGFANLNSTICNQQYDTARMIDGLGATIQGGFNAANIVALQGQNAIQTQLAQCCCENREGQAQIRYDMASNACAIQNAIQSAAQSIINNDNANYRQLHDENVALQIQGYKEHIATLQNALNRCDTQNVANAAVQSVVQQIRPTPEPAWIVPNPFGYQGSGYGYGYGNGCGFAC